MDNETLKKVTEERDSLHGVVHTFVEEFRLLKIKLTELEADLEKVTKEFSQLKLKFPQNKP